MHAVEVTTAATHDSAVVEACLHGEEEEIYGGYGLCFRRTEGGSRSSWGTVVCESEGCPRPGLSEADKAFNQKHQRIRARVEHPFGVIKHVWGYRKTRYRGLAKNAAQVYTRFALANFYMARKRLAGL